MLTMTILSIFCFGLFRVVFEYFYVLNLFLSRTPQDFAQNSRFFSCLLSLCLTVDFKNSFLTCPKVGDF